MLMTTKNVEMQQKTIEDALSSINSSEFVSLDLEFSGLFRSGGFKQANHLESYYNLSSASASQFLAIQLGLCTVRRSNHDSNLFILTPFNFYIFPQRRKIFLADTTAFHFLHKEGFDFQRWLSEGFDYARLADLQHNKPTAFANASITIVGLQRLIEKIIETQKPVVFHNGFFDLLHLLDKFVSELPGDLTSFSQEILRLFPGGIYDTKRIIEEGRYSKFGFGIARKGSTSLAQLQEYFLRSLSSGNIKLLIDPLGRRERGSVGYSLGGGVKRRMPGGGALILQPPLTKGTSQNVECGDGGRGDGGKVGDGDGGKGNGGSKGGDNEGQGESISNHKGEDNPEKEVVLLNGFQEGDAEERQSRKRRHVETNGPTSSSKAHEAGYDAMVTAQVFLYELERIFTTKGNSNSSSEIVLSSNSEIEGNVSPVSKTPSATSTAGPMLNTALIIPMDWATAEDGFLNSCCRNNIEITGISPGHLSLDWWATSAAAATVNKGGDGLTTAAAGPNIPPQPGPSSDESRHDVMDDGASSYCLPLAKRKKQKQWSRVMSQLKRSSSHMSEGLYSEEGSHVIGSDDQNSAAIADDDVQSLNDDSGIFHNEEGEDPAETPVSPYAVVPAKGNQYTSVTTQRHQQLQQQQQQQSTAAALRHHHPRPATISQASSVNPRGVALFPYHHHVYRHPGGSSTGAASRRFLPTPPPGYVQASWNSLVLAETTEDP